MTATPLPGLAKGDDLRPIFLQKSKTYDEKTISAGSSEALVLKLAGEEADGWQTLKLNKRSIRLKKAKPKDRQLEDDTWCLLYRMGFHELNTGRTFSIKVDEKTNPRQINALRAEIVTAIHRHYGLPRLKVKFAIATQDITVRDADKVAADKAGIAIITEVDLEYFDKLTSFLKHAARYQFLGRYLRDERVDGLRTKVSATRGRMGNQVFYNFLISPHDLLKIAYISHKAKTSNDDIETYQRMVKPARLKKIGRYIDNGGLFPTNVVVNLKATTSLQFDRSAQKDDVEEAQTGFLHLPGLYGSAWVIDGQHRLYGYAHSSRKSETDRSVITVLAYENLPIRDEIKAFVDINTQQVKVPAILVKEIVSSLDINDADPKKRLDALEARVVLMLDDHDPTKRRILTVSAERDHHRCLSLNSFSDGLSDNSLLGTIQRTGRKGGYITPGPLGDLSDNSNAIMNKAVRVISLYLNLFASKAKEHWNLGDTKGGYLCTNVGIRALLRLFGKIITFIETSQNVKAASLDAEDIVQRVEPYVKHVVDYFANATVSDIEDVRRYGSSRGGVDHMAYKMMSVISAQDGTFTTAELTKWMKEQDIEGTKEAQSMISDMETIIYDDVIATLKELYGEDEDTWWKQGVPPTVRNVCDKQWNESEDEGKKRFQYLYLVNFADIIIYKDNWNVFKDYYSFREKGTKKADLVSWIHKINKARQTTHHGPKGTLSEKEVEYVRRVYRLVKTHISGKEKVDLKSVSLSGQKPYDLAGAAE